MPIIIECEQLSEEWFEHVRGNPGASQLSNIITSTGKPSTSATKYMYGLAGILAGALPEESYQNKAMQIGIERQPEATALFRILTGLQVRQVGLVYKDERRLFHCSPDGLIGDDGGLEIKCPSLAVHVGYYLDGKLPTDYVVQVQSSMYIAEREYWYFMSYYPGLEPLILKVNRDKEFHEKLKVLLEDFCVKLLMTVKKLKEGKN